MDTKNPPEIIYVKDITTKPIFVTGLNYGTIYYWRVIAKYSDGSVVDGPVWKFMTLDKSSSTTPTTGNGYALFLDSLTVAKPNIINVIFQVRDLNGNGITNLKLDNFEVYEDSQPLSISESEMQINPTASVSYSIKTVLMLDNSTSLKNEIDSIRNAALSFINNILDYQQIAVYEFSEKITLLTDFTSDKSVLDAAIKSYALGVESTNFYGAVKKGTTLWNDTYTYSQILQGAMVLITDGNDTQGSSTLADAVNAVHDKVVFTIGLGEELQQEIMDAIGTAGYYQIENIDQLDLQFKIIEQKIKDYSNSFYLLTYKSPKRGYNDHILTIRVKNNPHAGDNSFITGSFNSGGF